MEPRYIWFDDVKELSLVLRVYLEHPGNPKYNFTSEGLILDSRVVRSPLLKELYL